MFKFILFSFIYFLRNYTPYDYNKKGTDWSKIYLTCGSNLQSPIQIVSSGTADCDLRGMTVKFNGDKISVVTEYYLSTLGNFGKIYLKNAEGNVYKYNVI